MKSIPACGSFVEAAAAFDFVVAALQNEECGQMRRRAREIRMNRAVFGPEVDPARFASGDRAAVPTLSQRVLP